VSPSLTSHTRVVVAPTQLVARRYSPGFKPRIAAESRLTTAGPMSLAQRADAIASVLGQVAQPVKPGRPRPGVDLTILDAFHHVFSVPCSSALKSDEDWQRFARFRASELLGGAPAQWRVRLSPAGRGNARLAGALHESDIEALESSIAAAGARLNGVRTSLSSLLSHHGAATAQDALPGGTSWLVVLEPRCLIIARLGQGRVQTLSQRRLSATLTGTSAGALVATWLDREARLLGLDPQTAAGTVRCVAGRRAAQVQRDVGAPDPVPAAVDRLIAEAGDLESDIVEACFS
jgi:hypothetical protein